jgi:hypothetical protein
MRRYREERYRNEDEVEVDRGTSDERLAEGEIYAMGGA